MNRGRGLMKIRSLIHTRCSFGFSVTTIDRPCSNCRCSGHILVLSCFDIHQSLSETRSRSSEQSSDVSSFLTWSLSWRWTRGNPGTFPLDSSRSNECSGVKGGLNVVGNIAMSELEIFEMHPDVRAMQHVTWLPYDHKPDLSVLEYWLAGTTDYQARVPPLELCLSA